MSLQKFHKQRTKILDELDHITHLTVHGISIKSDFCIELQIVVADTLGETTHLQSFPITIRSKKSGEFINDLESLGAHPGP